MFYLLHGAYSLELFIITYTLYAKNIRQFTAPSKYASTAECTIVRGPVVTPTPLGNFQDTVFMTLYNSFSENSPNVLGRAVMRKGVPANYECTQVVKARMVNQRDIIFKLVHRSPWERTMWVCSTFYRLRLLSSERISSCPKRFLCADIWTIFEDFSFLIFSREPNIFKDCLGRDAWNLRVLATSLFWIIVESSYQCLKIFLATSDLR